MKSPTDGEFPAIVEAYQDALYRFALRLTGSAEEAEETAQEAFIRAYRWLQANPGAGKELALKPWLYQVTLNVFRNRARRARLPSASLDGTPEPADGERGPAAAAEQAETRRELATLLARLPRRYREAVVLRHVEELTYPEIASVLDRPEGTIKSDVHRGLALLRAALTPAREEVLV